MKVISETRLRRVY